MKKYIGTKEIEAEPMTMGVAYEKGLLQVGLVPNETQKENKGYHVKYSDGYESWSPAEAFEKAYRVSDTFLDRLYIELSDLSVMRNKLNAFLNTERFIELPRNKKHLLTAQYGVMLSYAHILLERIRLEEEKGK